MALAASDSTMADTTSLPQAILLIDHPAWDVVGTLVDIRWTGVANVNVLQRVNVAVTAVAAVDMIMAVTLSVGHAVVVFDIWAIVAGAIMLIVAIRRVRNVGIQWPMFISGGLALFIG